MKNRKEKEIALVASGIILGTAIAAPVAGAALTAQRSTQKIFADGKRVQIETYSIGGSNYCKLRDVGKAVGFHVSYDALTTTVRINIDEAYEGEASASATIKLPTDGSRSLPRGGRLILLLSALMKDRTEFIGTPTELAELIDPAGMNQISPRKISGEVLKNLAALRENGIEASVCRSNGKRLIELRRADSVDTSGGGNSVPIDPDALATGTPL